MAQNDFSARLESDAALVERALEVLPFKNADADLKGITDAQKYSLLAGGKRIRPIIALAFCRLFGGEDDAVMPYAVALEMVHTASLIHDDMPCIDNDDLRRGKPTNHKIFGESTALLAGDGLFIDAFRVIAENEKLRKEVNCEAILTLSREAGTGGIVGGEFIDILGELVTFDLNTLEKMHKLKTGALIRASAILGALAAGVGREDARMRDVITYADAIGLTFQIIDDVLDVMGTADALGKNPGADTKENKTTYLSFFSVSEAKIKAAELTALAVAAMEKYEGSQFLIALAKYLLTRES